MSTARRWLTQRLVLSAVSAEDVDALHELYADPRGWEHAPAGRHEDRRQTEEVVRAAVEQWEREGLAYWVAREQATGRLVGTGGARRDADGAWNLYWHVHADARGRGYALELGRAALEAARARDPEAPVVARIRSEHLASRRVAERLGLVAAAERRDADGVVRIAYLLPDGRSPAERQSAAVLFDVDGTLLDTLPALRVVWRSWARLHGLDGDEVFEVALRGVPRATFEEVAPHLDPDACLAELHRIEDADAETGDCQAFAGARGLLEALPAGSWAVVTSNYEHRVRTRLARAGLPVPQVVVDAETVPRGKPFPDGYELAARLLSCEASRCLVLEDSASGVGAAKAAGMTVWAVNTSQGHCHADRSFATLTEAVPAVLQWLRSPRRSS